MRRGVDQNQEPLALQTARACGFGGGGDFRRAQPIELCGAVDDHRAIVARFQQAQPEARHQRGDLGVAGPQAYFCRLGELRTGTHHVVVLTQEQLHGFGIEQQVLALLVKFVDACEQRRVQVDRVLVGRQLRLDFAIELIQGVVAVRRVQVAEGLAHANQQLAGALQGQRSILETRRRRIGRDRAHFTQLPGHPGRECREEIAILDAIKGRHAIGQAARRREGIVGG